MTIEAGQDLSHYRLVEKIGEGGMGVVWKALDTNLKREVAIKVLPKALSAEAERIARFEREAKLLGSLDHPSIATVYGLHEVEGTRFIAMEFVPGEDLSQRLARGAMPLDEAKEVAAQIAGALEAAHERGVIHRDLKPANVRLTEDGQIKVLDFGLAKTLGAHPGASYDPELPPTVTSDRTRDGVILGTAAYMSPEQARGRPVDRRCDVWAFGCLLYECLTARKAFPGETISDTLAAILKSEPNWNALPVGTPQALHRLLRRCLAKDPRRRLSSLGDARLEIEDADREAVVQPPPSRWSPWLVLPFVAALLAVALTIFLTGRGARNPEDEISFKRLTHQRGWVRSAQLSSDGQTLVYSAAWEGKPLRLFMRRLDGTEALPVPLEPSHARVLSISSRGELAILLPAEPEQILLPPFRSGTLARLPLTGGTPRAVAENVFEADWSPSGEELAVVCGADRGARLEYPTGKVLYESPGEIGPLRVSPSGDLVAFFDYPIVNNNRGTVAVVNRDGKTKTLTPELESLDGLAWSPDGGEIWFSGADEASPALFAVTTTGQLRVLRRSPGYVDLYDVTQDGDALVGRNNFRLGIAGLAPGEELERDLSWMGAAFITDISADGRQISFMRQDVMEYDAWLRRTDGSAPVRLGAGACTDLSRDGRWALAASLDLEKPLTLLPTGAGEPRVLDGITGAVYAALTPDGENVVWAATTPGGRTRLRIKSISGGEATVVSEDGIVAGIDRPFHISPDGRWVAALNQEGVIRLYPVDGGKARELAGFLPGDEPSGWTVDGRALFVMRSGSMPAQVFRVDLDSGERLPWLDLMPQDPAGVGGIYAFVITPDGGSYAYSYVRRIDSLYFMTGLE